MTDLSYLTKENSSPNGKPRVYFCAHPNDYAILEELSNDIWITHNCVIYYNHLTSNTDINSSFLDNLEQMQLCIISITDAFINYNNLCKDSIIPYTLSHNIPIAPIATKSGLARKFNQIFPNIQVIHKHNDDDVTEISYRDKLKKFLDSVLLSDDIIKEIDSAFDGTIFLSYRKKDRYYAQKLIESIHKEEQFQGVSVWYDEFLTPGNNYHNDISNALVYSDLVILLVSPNILEINEGKMNYVMRVEFPMIIQNKKHLIPVEMIETDRTLVNKYYSDMPEIISFNDTEKLLSLLTHHLVNITKDPINRTPKSNYLLGLAYLSGIHVEVNIELAVKYIKTAASQGFSDAISKIKTMYYIGHGVSKNIEEALYWSKQELQVLGNSYESAPNDFFTKRSYIVSLLEHANFCRHTGRPNEAKNLYEKVVSLSYETEYTDLKETGYILLADVLHDVGDLTSCINIQKQLYENFKSELSNDKNHNTYRKLGSTLARLGNYTRNDSDAMVYFKELIELKEECLNLYGDLLSRFDYLDVANTFCSTSILAEKSIFTYKDIMLKGIRIGEEFIDNQELNNIDKIPIECGYSLPALYSYLSGLYISYLIVAYAENDNNLKESIRERLLYLLDISYSVSETMIEKARVASNYYNLALCDYDNNTATILDKAKNIINYLYTNNMVTYDISQLKEKIDSLSKGINIINSEANGYYNYVKYYAIPHKIDIETTQNTEYDSFKRRYQWKQKHLCQYCGGAFGGLFTKKCINCGKEKDY